MSGWYIPEHRVAFDVEESLALLFGVSDASDFADQPDIAVSPRAIEWVTQGLVRAADLYEHDLKRKPTRLEVVELLCQAFPPEHYFSSESSKESEMPEETNEPAAIPPPEAASLAPAPSESPPSEPTQLAPITDEVVMAAVPEPALQSPPEETGDASINAEPSLLQPPLALVAAPESASAPESAPAPEPPREPEREAAVSPVNLNAVALAKIAEGLAEVVQAVRELAPPGEASDVANAATTNLNLAIGNIQTIASIIQIPLAK